MSGLLLLRRPLHARCLSSRLCQVRRYALIGKRREKREPVWALPSTPARTRFAPSPTGYLHLGSMRTALFNFLLAQATGGQFILRLEDTDQTRFVPDAEARLYEDLRWAGLEWDEGPDKGGDVGPYKQSQRLDLYRQHAHQLLERGHAFRCFCSKGDLEFNIKRATASGATAHYPGTCLGIGKAESDRRAAVGEPHTIRFKASATPVTAPDLVYGPYKKAEQEDDFIIMKSDGFPTYHFANVVDDHFMKITHVIRGAEWLISTPKHVELYNAFGWQPPHFAHVGLLVDQQRQKLSKRDMDNIGISIYRQHHILPAALLNFSVLLGWDPKLQDNPHLDKRGLMTLEDMKNNFTLKFTRGDIVVDLSKLKYFQARIRRDVISGQVTDPAGVSQITAPMMSELEKIHKGLEEYHRNPIPENSGPGDIFSTIRLRENHINITEDYALKVLKAWKGSLDDPSQFAYDNIHAFYPIHKSVLRDECIKLLENVRRVRRKNLSTPQHVDLSNVLLWFRHQLAQVKQSDWTGANIGDVTKKLVDAVEYYDVKKKQLMDQSAGWKLMRWALLAGKSGLSVIPMMELWGRKETLARLKLARKEAAAVEKLQLEEHTQDVGGSGREYTTTDRDRGREDAQEREDQEDQEDQSPQQQEAPKGPFQSRPPAPAPVKSPRREPKDVERQPQFLKFDQFMSGQRRLDLDKDDKDKGCEKEEDEDKKYAPSFGELPRRELPPRKDATRADHWTSPGPRNRTCGPRLRPIHPDVPSNKLPPPRRGPFLPGDPIKDYKGHVAHVRAINQALHVKKARAQSRTDNPESSEWGRLEDLKSSRPGPMYVAKALGKHPLGFAAARLRMAAGKAVDASRRDNWQAQSPTNRFVSVGKAADDSTRDKWQVQPPTDISRSMISHVEATWREERAKNLVNEAYNISVDDLERKVATLWKKRNG